MAVKSEEFKKLQQKHYHDMTVREDIDKRRATRNHYKKIKAISDFFDIQEGDNVLEVGVGTGIHADRLLDMNSEKSFSLAGIDLSDDLLEITRKKLEVRSQLNGGRQGINLQSMDAENLGFKDETFDKVYIGSTLHHLPTPEIGVKEMMRVLKPGGKICIMEPNYIHPKNIYFCHSREAEKNMVFMKKKFFRRWLDKQDVEYSIENFIYTPPWPKFMTPVFEVVEGVVPVVPVLRNFSIMLFVSGVKGS